MLLSVLSCVLIGMYICNLFLIDCVGGGGSGY